MRRKRKALFWGLGLLGGLAAFIVLALLTAPSYLNRPKVRRSIEAALSRRLGAEVTFDRISILLRPLPEVRFEHAGISMPGMLKGTALSVSVYPRLLSLLHGTPAVSRIRSVAPDLSIVLPGTLAKGHAESPSLTEVKHSLLLLRSGLASIGPRIMIEMDDGSVNIARSDRNILSVRHAGAEIDAAPDRVHLTLQAVTEQWDGFRFSGDLLLDEQAAEVKDLSFRLGTSDASGLTTRLSWGANPEFELLGGKARLVLDELLPLASASDILRPFLKDLRSIQGNVQVFSIRIGGPLASLKSWKTDITGQLRDVVIRSDRLPAAVAISGGFGVADDAVSFSGLSAAVGRSSLAGAAGRFRWNKEPRILIQSGRASLSLDDLDAWRSRYPGLLPDRVQSVGGKVGFSSLRLSGPLFHPFQWQVSGKGTVQNVVLFASGLPGAVHLTQGAFTASPAGWSLSDGKVQLQDASFSFSCSFSGPPADIGGADITMSGTFGGETVDWIFVTFDLPKEARPQVPVTLSALHIGWIRSAVLSLKGSVRIADGPSVAWDLVWRPGMLELKRLAVSDRDSKAFFSANRTDRETEFGFSGHLSQSTVHRIFPSQRSGSGRIAGGLHLTVHADPKRELEAQGTLVITEFSVPWGRAPTLRINHLSLQTSGSLAVIREGSVSFGGAHYDLSGTVAAEGRRIILDGDVAADRITVSNVVEALKGRRVSGAAKGDQEKVAGPALTVHGLLRVKAKELEFSGRRFTGVDAQVAFGPKDLNMTFTKADLCGLSIPGTVIYDRGQWQLDLRASEQKGRVDQLLSCLTGQSVNISGTFNLQAALRSHGEGGLAKNLSGQIQGSAEDGKIYRYPLLAKIFSVLSVTEVLRGKIPELGGSGFPYHRMLFTAKVEQGSLRIEQALIDGSSLTVIAEGKVDLATRKADLVVLVAPFSTINWIIRHIPLVGKLLGGTLISVPVKVSGDLSDPDVVFLAPSAVGSRIVNLLENVLELPVDIISPLLPEKGEKHHQE